MTRVSITPRVTVTATWHDDNLTRGNFLIFFKNFKKKIKNKKKIQKKNNKKIQKIEELTRGTSSNGVNLDLTARANVRRFNKKGDHFETFKNMGTILRF